VVVGLAYYICVFRFVRRFSAVFIAFFVIFPFSSSIEIMVYNGVVLSALIYGVYGDGDDGDKMDEFKTPMVYSINDRFSLRK
jgi:hypothetical protein